MVTAQSHHLHPLCRCAALPPKGAARGLYEFAQGFIKPQVPAATPQPLRRQLPFQGRLGEGLFLLILFPFQDEAGEGADFFEHFGGDVLGAAEEGEFQGLVVCLGGGGRFS